MDRVLFWDFDGTLAYPNKSFFTALHGALCENGYDCGEDECVNFSKSLYSWKTPQIDYADKTGELWWETHFDKIRSFCDQKNIPAADMDRICGDFRKKLIDVSNYALYDDTVKTLERCVELGYRNYLITNNYPEIVENLEKLQISPFFSGYIVSSHIGYEKPRGEFFNHAKKLAGSPQNGYVIGDNPVADIRGGKDAGWTTIAVHECRQNEADHYCETLTEILNLLP